MEIGLDLPIMYRETEGGHWQEKQAERCGKCSSGNESKSLEGHPAAQLGFFHRANVPKVAEEEERAERETCGPKGPSLTACRSPGALVSRSFKAALGGCST